MRHTRTTMRKRTLTTINLTILMVNSMINTKQCHGAKSTPVEGVTEDFRRLIMKRFVRRLALLSAALMLFAVPVMADNGSGSKHIGQGDKDVCILAARSCGEMDAIQRRIERLTIEISKGSEVYNNDELRILYRELDNEVLNLRNLGAGG